MPDSIFEKVERRHVKSFVDSWMDLAGQGKQRDEDGNLYALRDRLVDEIIASFFIKFPHRDIIKSPNDSRAFNQITRDTLHSKIRSILYAAAAKQEGRQQHSTQKKSKVSLLTVFKQRYGDRILSRRDQLATSKEPAALLSAYNQAVQQELAALRETEPDAYEKLQESVHQLRMSSNLPFEQQSPETQRSLLDLLPVLIAKTVKNWGHTTGASIYVMAAWNSETGGPSGFDCASKGCGSYLKSQTAIDVRDGWFQWMRDYLGGESLREAKDALPAVYEGPDGWPMLPDIDKIRLSISSMKPLIRRYLHCTSMAQGGSVPPYKRIESAMRDEQMQIVPSARMPPGMTVLKDINYWSREDYDRMLKHVLAGQRAQIPSSQRFCWGIIFPPRPALPLALRDAQPKLLPGAVVSWTANERLYGRLMAEQPGSHGPELPSSGQEHWNGLPLARTSHVYAAYTVDLYNHLQLTHQDHAEMRGLIDEVAQMEADCPIHIGESMSTKGPAYSPYIPRQGEQSLARRLNPADMLEVAFFRALHEQHIAFSLTALFLWITQSRPHIHQESQTVFAGPLGVRNVVFALSRVLQGLKRVEVRDKVPTAIQRAIANPDNNWSLSHCRKQVDDCIRELRRQVARSRTILGATLTERKQEWERQVELALQRPAEHEHETVVDSGVSATSGIPRSRETLKAMAALIADARLREESDAEAADVSTVVTRRVHPIMSRPRHNRVVSDPSAEFIRLSHVGGSSDNDHDMSVEKSITPTAELISHVRSPGRLDMHATEAANSLVVAAQPTGTTYNPARKQRRKSNRATTRLERAEEAIRVLPKGNYITHDSD